MIYLQIIGVTIGLLFLCKLAATPINEYLYPIKAEIIIEPKTHINYIPAPTPKPITEPLKIEKYPEIRNFLNNLPDCNWCVACGSYAHYTRIEAEKQNISIHETTLTTPNNSGLDKIKYGLGHRINFFYTDDGHKVYIDNMYNWKLILELDELIPHLKNKFNINPERIGFKNTKL